MAWSHYCSSVVDLFVLDVVVLGSVVKGAHGECR